MSRYREGHDEEEFEQDTGVGYRRGARTPSPSAQYDHHRSQEEGFEQPTERFDPHQGVQVHTPLSAPQKDYFDRYHGRHGVDDNSAAAEETEEAGAEDGADVQQEEQEVVDEEEALFMSNFEHLTEEIRMRRLANYVQRRLETLGDDNYTPSKAAWRAYQSYHRPGVRTYAGWLDTLDDEEDEQGPYYREIMTNATTSNRHADHDLDLDGTFDRRDFAPGGDYEYSWEADSHPGKGKGRAADYY